MEHFRHVSLLFLYALVLCLSGNQAWGRHYEAPKSVPKRAADVVPVPEFVPTTSSQLGKWFQRIEQTPSCAEVRQALNGKKFIYLPVEFKGKAQRRVGWDVTVNEDWSEASEVVFDFMAGKDQEVAGLNIYCHSVDGWYSASFGLDLNEGWSRITIGKAAFGVEGRPRGWSKIDTVRISTWRYQDGQEGWFGLANLGVRKFVQGRAKLLVIRGDSCMESYKSEATAFSRYAGTLLTSLKACGLEAVMLSDREVTPESLKPYKVAMLPYNPSLPPAAKAALKEFVAGGGKVIGFYNLPQEISALLGVTYEAEGWKQHPSGNYGGFLATKHALKGQPELVPQASYCTMVPRRGHHRVLATWAEPDGSNTGIPALMLVPNGAYVSHVWLNHDGDKRLALLEALISEFVPVDRVGRLRRRLSELGKQDVRGDWNSLKERVAASDNHEAARSLQTAEKLRKRARRLLNGGDWENAMHVIKDAEEAASRAFFLTCPSRKDEERLFWCHNADGVRGWSWDQAIKYLADCGFTAIIPNMCWAGVAYYDSEVLPRYPKFAEQGDRLRQCLDACNKYGVTCHVWKVCFNMGGHASKAFSAAMVKAGRVQVSRSGEVNARWLCPSHPLNQQAEIDAMVELARRYPDLHGVHFDYIRYSNGDVCWCAGCRERFEAYLGRAVKSWPFDRKDAKLWASWEEFRRQNITRVVRKVHEKVRKIRPDMEISAAVFSLWPDNRNDIAQDWELWCRKGWLDFVCPMDYQESDLAFRSLIKVQKQWSHGVRLYPGIGLSCWQNSTNAYRLVRQIELVRRAGLPGFTVFHYGKTETEPMKWLKLGCLRKR